MTDIHISYPSSILVPREAYRYWPSSEFILRGSGKKSSRFIFENQTLTAFEQEKLSRLIKEFQKKRLQLPATYSTNHLLRFCYGGGWKTKKSLNGLIAHLNWIQTAIPGGYRLLYPKIFALLNTIDDYTNLLCFLLEYMLDKMLLPGQIENWMVLCDMCRLGLGNISISSLKQVMGILQVNYKCRLGNNFIVNTPKSLWVVWSCVKPFVDEITIEKVKIAKGLHSDEMLAMFNPGQVEEKYGGKAKNLTNYWPPTVPDSPFAVPGKLSLLTEKDSYFQHYSKEDTIEDDSSEIIEKYEEEKQECSVNSLEIEESDVEFDLETDHAVMCRSQLGQNEVLEDFENAMPFTKTYERNPTFKDISKRDSEVFLASHSIKNLHEDLEIINSSNNAESSRYTIIEAEEVTQCRLLGCEGMNCVSF